MKVILIVCLFIGLVSGLKLPTMDEDFDDDLEPKVVEKKDYYYLDPDALDTSSTTTTITEKPATLPTTPKTGLSTTTETLKKQDENHGEEKLKRGKKIVL